MFVKLVGCKATLPVDIGGFKIFDAPTYFDDTTGKRMLANNKGVLFECTKDGEIIGELPKPAEPAPVQEDSGSAPESAPDAVEVPASDDDSPLEISMDVEFDPSTATKAQLIEKCREKGISASKNDTVKELQAKLASPPTPLITEQE